jgi:hypothetical protein
MNMRPFARRTHLLIFFLLLSAVLLMNSCGRKDRPTLKSFEKPETVKEIRILHRKEGLILSWSYPEHAVSNISGFYIDKAEGGETKFRNVRFLNSDVFTFTDPDCLPGTLYRYKIRAYSLKDVIGDDSAVITVTPAEPPPPPSGLSFKISGKTLEISWAPAGPGVLYNIYKTYESGKEASSLLNRAPLGGTSFRDRIEPERSVYYAVRSLLDTPVGDEGLPSPAVEVSPASFVPSPPVGLLAVPSEHFVMLTWRDNPETWTRGYRVYRKMQGETGFGIIGETLSPLFKDPVKLTTVAAYRVAAMGPTVESRPSEIIETLLPAVP